MKNLKIGLGFMSLLLLGFQLQASDFNRIENENQSMAPKISQGDTVRIEWYYDPYNNTGSECTFSFYGEEGATYKVIWGDGQTDIVIGKGPDTAVRCEHRYRYSIGKHKVLLFGIPSEKK